MENRHRITVHNILVYTHDSKFQTTIYSIIMLNYKSPTQTYRSSLGLLKLLKNFAKWGKHRMLWSKQSCYKCREKYYFILMKLSYVYDIWEKNCTMYHGHYVFFLRIFAKLLLFFLTKPRGKRILSRQNRIGNLVIIGGNVGDRGILQILMLER